MRSQWKRHEDLQPGHASLEVGRRKFLLGSSFDPSLAPSDF